MINTAFQVGGSISSENSIYITRQADIDLFQALDEGELCYVFNSRQMGKSSLLLDVKKRFIKKDFICCFIDISRIGNVNISTEQWYAGIVSELWRALGLPKGKAMFDWWAELGNISAPQKLSYFWQNLLPEKFPNKDIIIFFDEVDSVLSLPFAADDFFSIMRSCYNNRAEDTALKKIRFALFGVALPSDLISNPSRSPFNIGKSVRLEGFGFDEALAFSHAFSFTTMNNKKLISRILFWTSGQPFLTQKLCQRLIETPAFVTDNEETWVDRIVQEQFINNWEQQDNPEHIRTIKDRILLDNSHCTQMLCSYLQILKAENHQLPIDQVDDINRLYLTGLIALDKKMVTSRTRIYRKIFTKEWVEKQLNAQRPYGDKFTLWQKSSYQDIQYLLSESELNKTKAWAENKFLPDIDHRYLNASQEIINSQVRALNAKLATEIEQRKNAEKEVKQMLSVIEQAKNDAEFANKSKSEFLARVSREVRTHMNSVLGLSYIAQQEDCNENSKNHLRKIHRAAQYMLGVVNDIVDINKVERGELTLMNESFFLDDVLDKVIDTVGFNIAKKELDFELKLPKMLLPALNGDPKRLEQILSNLLTNAIKHTEKGCISLSIKANIQTNNQNLALEFSVTDTGFGFDKIINKEKIEVLNTTRFKSGIGLNLCSELIAMMKGEFYLESTPNSGSCFTFNINLTTTGKSTSKTKSKSKTTASRNIYLDKNFADNYLKPYIACLGHQITTIELATCNKTDFKHASILIIDKNSYHHQSKLLELLHVTDSLHILPVVEIGEKLPHWLTSVGLNKKLEVPCSLRQLNNTIEQQYLPNIRQKTTNSKLLNSSIKILVAEDDEINQQIIKELLSNTGCKVTIVDNGLEALNAVKEQRYDLVLMDVEMPVMGGVAAVKSIKSLKPAETVNDIDKLPIIAITAHALIDDRQKFIRIGMNDHISKPIEPAILFDVIEEWLPNLSFVNEPQIPKIEIEIANIDTVAGLLRCGNNKKVYIKILQQFSHKYSKGLSFEGLKIEELSLLCHSIKGSSANIGATEVSILASDCENTCRNNILPKDSQLITLSKELILLCQSIQANDVVQSKQTKQSKKSNINTISALLKSLLKALKDDHAEAMIIVDKITDDDDLVISEIKSAMNIFDIDKAEELTSSWLKSQLKNKSNRK